MWQSEEGPEWQHKIRKYRTSRKGFGSYNYIAKIENFVERRWVTLAK